MSVACRGRANRKHVASSRRPAPSHSQCEINRKRNRKGFDTGLVHIHRHVARHRPNAPSGMPAPRHRKQNETRFGPVRRTTGPTGRRSIRGPKIAIYPLRASAGRSLSSSRKRIAAPIPGLFDTARERVQWARLRGANAGVRPCAVPCRPHNASKTRHAAHFLADRIDVAEAIPVFRVERRRRHAPAHRRRAAAAPAHARRGARRPIRLHEPRADRQPGVRHDRLCGDDGRRCRRDRGLLPGDPEPQRLRRRHRRRPADDHRADAGHGGRTLDSLQRHFLGRLRAVLRADRQARDAGAYRLRSSAHRAGTRPLPPRARAPGWPSCGC